MRQVGYFLVGLMLGCNAGAGDGLECRSGTFYLGGEKFTSCSQCSKPDTCSFDTSTANSYDSNGNQTSSSTTVTASCNGQRAKIGYSVDSAGSRSNEHCLSTGSSSPSTCKLSAVNLEVDPVPVGGRRDLSATLVSDCGATVSDGTKVSFGLFDLGDDSTGSSLSAEESTTTAGTATVEVRGGSTPGYVLLAGYASWGGMFMASDDKWLAVYDTPCFPGTGTLTVTRLPGCQNGGEAVSVAVHLDPIVPEQCPEGVADGTKLSLRLMDEKGESLDSSHATVEPADGVATSNGTANFVVRAGLAATVTLVGGVGDARLTNQTPVTFTGKWCDASVSGNVSGAAWCGSAALTNKPASCQCEGPGASSNCGSEQQDCCLSPTVPGGSFQRDNETASPASLSTFQLDQYEITVGRFRAFVRAGMGTKANPPKAGAGATPYVAKSGWDVSYNDYLVPAGGLDKALRCYADRDSWTGGDDNRPMNCITWYEAMAFCIWDGARLPTEAEWNYAAAGGDEQRRYPWGNSEPARDTDLAVYDLLYGSPVSAGDSTLPNLAPVGSAPAGNGRWLQSDLAGSLQEWLLDGSADAYPTTCVDCCNVTDTEFRVTRGGSFTSSATNLQTTQRSKSGPGARYLWLGARCARDVR